MSELDKRSTIGHYFNECQFSQATIKCEGAVHVLEPYGNASADICRQCGESRRGAA